VGSALDPTPTARKLPISALLRAPEPQRSHATAESASATSAELRIIALSNVTRGATAAVGRPAQLELDRSG
jgi:hypothetical protein